MEHKASETRTDGGSVTEALPVVYELWQDGTCVAIASAGSKQDALREISHYAMVYAQDGPVQIMGPFEECYEDVEP